MSRKINQYHLLNAEGRRFSEGDDDEAIIYKDDRFNNPNRMLAQDIALFHTVVDEFLWRFPSLSEISSFLETLSPELVQMAHRRARIVNPIFLKQRILNFHHRCPGAFRQAKKWLDNNHENLSVDDLIAKHRQLGEEFIDGVETCVSVLWKTKLQGDDTSYLFVN